MRSYVDPIINAAVISQLDLRRDLPSLLQLDFPEIFLPTFLHEGTHHAVVHVAPRHRPCAPKNAGLSTGDTPSTNPHGDHWDLLEDVLRQEVTMELLRPISEGLACFSELNSVPGRSNVITTPMCSTFFNFGGPEHELKTREVLREHGINLFLFSLLYRARLDPDLTQRRENVLAGRFPLKFGGHLAGYVALKNIWGCAKAKSRSAGDAELFSMYVRSFFYDDYSLIAVLLDESMREHDAANAIGSYVRERLKQLITLDWDVALELFEKEFGRTEASKRAGAHLMHVLPGGLASDARLRDLGATRLEQLFAELIEVEGLDEVQRLMRGFDLHRLRKRELLCLGSLEADIEVNSYRRVLVRPREGGRPDDMPTVAVQALDGVPEGQGEGSLEFYLIPLDNARVSAIVRGRELVHVHFEGPISEPRRRQLSSALGTRSKDLKVIQEQEANLEFVIHRDAISVVRDQAKVTAPQAIEEIYLWLSTLPVDSNRWRSAADALSSGGLFKLCGGDAEFIRGLAFLGVASSVSRDKAELVETAKSRGIDLADLCRKAKAIQAATGFPMIVEGDGDITVLV